MFVNCETCGNPIHTYPSLVALGRGKYCSRACRTLRKEYPCITCGKPVLRVPSAAQGLVACSRTCLQRRERNLPTLEERFLAIMADVPHTPTGCWEWPKGGHTYGYGSLSAKKVHFLTHRISYALFNGPLDPETQVLHTCDNPPCVEPTHLYQGTPAHNARDRVERGRVARGFMLPHTRLSENDVTEIRRLALSGKKQVAIAAMFHIHQSYVSDIVRGKSRLLRS